MPSDEVNSLIERAKQGDLQAQYELGKAYENGDGVLQDFAKATDLYRGAAEKGLADAQLALGKMHYDGKGVKKNLDEAHRWVYMAVQQNHQGAVDFMRIIKAVRPIR